MRPRKNNNFLMCKKAPYNFGKAFMAENKQILQCRIYPILLAVNGFLKVYESLTKALRSLLKIIWTL